VLKDWVLRMADGKEFQLTKEQVDLVNLAAEQGKRFVHFGELAINVNFVERYWKIKPGEPFPDHPEVKMSKEKMAEGLRRLKEITNKF